MQASRSDNRDRAPHGDAAPGARSADELAIIAAAKREPRAFEPLYRRYAGLVYHFALGQLRDPHRAEDAWWQASDGSPGWFIPGTGAAAID